MELGIYILKGGIVGIIAGLTAAVLFIVATFIISVVSLINGGEVNDIQGIVIYAASIITYSMIVVLLQMDLSIQFLISTKDKIKD